MLTYVFLSFLFTGHGWRAGLVQPFPRGYSSAFLSRAWSAARSALHAGAGYGCGGWVWAALRSWALYKVLVTCVL